MRVREFLVAVAAFGVGLFMGSSDNQGMREKECKNMIAAVREVDEQNCQKREESAHADGLRVREEHLDEPPGVDHD